MSVLDSDYIDKVETSFRLGRWLYDEPRVSEFYSPKGPLMPGGQTELEHNGIAQADIICRDMFRGIIGIKQLWQIIGDIEITPDWIENWRKVLHTIQDTSSFNRLQSIINTGIEQKIANKLCECFADYNMHQMSAAEWLDISRWTFTLGDHHLTDFYTGPTLQADWMGSSMFIKIYASERGVAMTMCFMHLEDDPVPVRVPSWQAVRFFLELIPDKDKFDNPFAHAES